MTHYSAGLEHAELLVRKTPGEATFWLYRARQGRRRWSTRLFRLSKRRFLDGLIAGLEAHLEQQGSGGLGVDMGDVSMAAGS
jgi:hypothetical protein